jgi:A/G-specific adenine glycosylase
MGAEPADAIALGATPARPARRVAERKQEPYLGSRRWYRGKIIDALRRHHALDRSSLGMLIKNDYQNDIDRAWLSELVDGLARDGLVVVNSDQVSLP